MFSIFVYEIQDISGFEQKLGSVINFEINIPQIP